MQRCPRPDCKRAGNDLGTCVDAQTIIGCPKPVDVDPKKDLVIDCRNCDKVFAITLDDIVRGRVDRPLCQGPTNICQAIILAPAKK